MAAPTTCNLSTTKIAGHVAPASGSSAEFSDPKFIDRKCRKRHILDPSIFAQKRRGRQTRGRILSGPAPFDAEDDFTSSWRGLQSCNDLTSARDRQTWSQETIPHHLYSLNRDAPRDTDCAPGLAGASPATSTTSIHGFGTSSLRRTAAASATTKSFGSPRRLRLRLPAKRRDVGGGTTCPVIRWAWFIL